MNQTVKIGPVVYSWDESKNLDHKTYYKPCKSDISPTCPDTTDGVMIFNLVQGVILPM